MTSEITSETVGDIRRTDPIRFQVLYNAFSSIVDEMGALLQKVAFSLVVSEGREKHGEFRGIGGEGIPGVAVAVVDDGAGVEDLLDPIGIFAYDADDHVEEFGETEGLFDDGTHTDVAGVFVGVAERNLVG